MTHEILRSIEILRRLNEIAPDGVEVKLCYKGFEIHMPGIRELFSNDETGHRQVKRRLEDLVRRSQANQ